MTSTRKHFTHVTNAGLADILYLGGTAHLRGPNDVHVSTGDFVDAQFEADERVGHFGDLAKQIELLEVNPRGGCPQVERI